MLNAAGARKAMLGDTGEDFSEQEMADQVMNAGGDDEEDTAASDRDADLIASLRVEEQASIGNDSDQIADEQIRAFERYLGKDYGDEIEGASRVHTREVFETIEAMRPKFKRMFGRGATAITVEPWAEGEEVAQQAQDAQDYLRAVLFGDPEQLDGHAIFDDFFFDGALQKIGVGAVCWEEAELGPPQDIEGLTLEQAQQLDAEAKKEGAELELLELEPEDETGTSYRAVIQEVRRPAKAVIEIIAPEDFRCSKTAVSLANPAYCGHKIRMPLSRVKSMWPDKAEEIEEYGSGDAVGIGNDERRQARFWDLDEAALAIARGDDEEIEVEILREYIRFDYDGDGYPELLETWRMGDLLLEAEPADDNCYFYWTPIRIPHRLIGLSIADIEGDIQRTNTVHLRNANNASALAVTPRKVVHPGHLNMPDLLNVRAGAIIRMNQQSAKMPQEVIHNEVTPDLSGAALKMMDKMDRLTERRTGVTEHLQGMNPDVLNQTMGGIDLLQNAASERIECYAEAMAAGLGPGLTKFLRLHVAHMEGERNLPVAMKGQRRQYKKFKPGQWSPKLQVAVHAGQGTGNRQARIGQLTGIMTQQEKVVARFGPANPIVTPKHLHNTIEQICKEMGFLSADEFFADPETLKPEQLQAMMQPPPDPKMEAAMKALEQKMEAMKLDHQRDMLELQQKGQLKREEIAADAQGDREQLAAEVTLSREEMQTDALAKVAGAKFKGGPRTEVGGDKV